MFRFGKLPGLLSVGVVALVALRPDVGVAQSIIVPDDTLGEERSQVLQNFNGTPNEVITGGAQRGQNLFHSFEEFNIAEGRGAFFDSPAGLENIFSRVTGGNVSNILGTLGTTGASVPDLYLMNPNGIMFGPNASLDLGGAFTATTADAIGFGQEAFSALVPEVPSDLLSVDPSAFFFNQVPGAIVNRAQGGTGDRRGLINSGGVTVLGGDVLLEQGYVTTETGAIQVGGLAEPGTVELSSNGDVTFPTAVARSTINIANGRLSTLAGGNLAVWADALQVSGSFIITSTPIAVRAGDITIDATSILLQENSFVDSLGLEGSSGDIGNIAIVTSNLEIQDSRIRSLTFGAGKGGT
ncbi:MAG: filamentous hemagglutinin N-terminal domain-containing protein, partial [Elainellaceae cyanobacterium]